VRLELCTALAQQEGGLVVVVPRQVERAAHLPPVRLQAADEG
jgi:hypothetical protein